MKEASPTTLQGVYLIEPLLLCVRHTSTTISPNLDRTRCDWAVLADLPPRLYCELVPFTDLVEAIEVSRYGSTYEDLKEARQTINQWIGPSPGTDREPTHDSTSAMLDMFAQLARLIYEQEASRD